MPESILACFCVERVYGIHVQRVFVCSVRVFRACVVISDESTESLIRIWHGHPMVALTSRGGGVRPSVCGHSRQNKVLVSVWLKVYFLLVWRVASVRREWLMPAVAPSYCWSDWLKLAHDRRWKKRGLSYHWPSRFFWKCLPISKHFPSSTFSDSSLWHHLSMPWRATQGTSDK